MQVSTEFSLSLNLSLSLTAPSGPKPFISASQVTCSHRQNALLISSLQFPSRSSWQPQLSFWGALLAHGSVTGGFLCLLTPQQAQSALKCSWCSLLHCNSQNTVSDSSLKLLRSFEANTLTRTLFLSFLSTFLPSQSLMEATDRQLYRLPFAFT